MLCGNPDIGFSAEHKYYRSVMPRDGGHVSKILDQLHRTVLTRIHDWVSISDL